MIRQNPRTITKVVCLTVVLAVAVTGMPPVFAVSPEDLKGGSFAAGREDMETVHGPVALTDTQIASIRERVISLLNSTDPKLVRQGNRL